MAKQRIRVGLIGAGANTKLRHLPGFRALEDVEVTGVANRTPESSERAAQELHIPKAFPDWRSLVNSPDVDAICIGTWPNTHCEITIAALEAGKHVLTEARMARDLAEATRMQHAAQAHPHLIAMVVPSPFGLSCGPGIEFLLKGHYLGDLRELVVIGADDSFWDYSKPFHWRQSSQISGKNILTMGILHETALRWASPPVQVYAQTTVCEAQRPLLEESRFEEVTVPDSVQILTKLQNGGRGIYHISGITQFGPGKQIHLYGSRGTIKVEFGEKERLFVGHQGDKNLAEVTVPPERTGKWRVEEEFIAAIRGEEPVKLNDFATALKSMEFTEAVSLSATQNRPVDLPLKENS